MILKVSVIQRRKTSQAGFSMIEMLMVIGIIGILVGFGAVSYMKQLSGSRVDTGIQMLNASFKQARQSAIAMRRSRRVVIDAGRLDGLDGNPPTLSGSRLEPIQIWIEGKQCEEYLYSDKAVCISLRTNEINAIPLSDPEVLPSGVMITDVDGLIPGRGTTPRVFYIEFNPRGSVSKVYFDGNERTTNPNEIAPVIHLARDGEVFTLGDENGDYIASFDQFNRGNMAWSDPPTDRNRERYKVQTIEVVRLTGKTRTYDYAILNPWPIDELVK